MLVIALKFVGGVSDLKIIRFLFNLLKRYFFYMNAAGEVGNGEYGPMSGEVKSGIERYALLSSHLCEVQGIKKAVRQSASLLFGY
jgi:hypothetical protein